MYVRPNFKTKKALVDAVKAGQEVRLESPGLFPPPLNGKVSVEGPHFPEPHRWYATVEIKNGRVIKVK